ncbi:MAG: hypothetical protein FDX21_11165 [Chlorobium sp.]|nr:MAG: hypothetical protein FDX21_11165 [Chlorobium sp.]
MSERYRINKLMKVKLAELEQCESQIKDVLPIAQESFERSKIHKKSVDSIWLPIRDTQLFLIKLHFINDLARISAQGLRIVFYSFALFVTIILDKYTPAVDIVMQQLKISNFHTGTVLLIFLIQVLVLDASITPLISSAYSKLLRWIITAFKDVVEKVGIIEKKLCDAEIILEESRSSPPKPPPSPYLATASASSANPKSSTPKTSPEPKWS